MIRRDGDEASPTTMSTHYDIVNPYDGSPLGPFAYTTRDDVQLALERLERGKQVMARLSAHQRAEILTTLAALLLAHAEQLARRITEEIGKTLRDSRAELQRAATTILCAANEARQIHGEVLDSDAYPPARGCWGIVHRRPLGVVLAITPFNFPINLSVHKIGPAFAAGCPVLYKPSPRNYVTGRRLVALCHEAGMPEEAIQFCMPDIPVLTEIISSDAVQVISFTGGVLVSRAIARDASGKKLLFELGGNDPLIVMPDADIERAVDVTINQRFATAGQRCTAAKRVFVHAEVYDEFKRRLLAKTCVLVVGDPMDEATFVGPVVSGEAADTIERRIRGALADGATLLIGGTRAGNIIAPTILEHVSPASELCAEETFGPVIPLFRFDRVEEIVPIINGTGLGLQSGVFTNDLRTIKYLFEELEVGALAVNDGPGFRAEHFPFGGVGLSGLGREGVRYAIEEMTYLKTLIM